MAMANISQSGGTQIGGYKTNPQSEAIKKMATKATVASVLGSPANTIAKPSTVVQKGNALESSSAYKNVTSVLNDIKNTPTTYTPGGGSYSTPDNSYYNDLINQMMSQNAAARDSALAAIMSNLNAVKGTYNNQIRSVTSEYDNLVDENEVAKDRARRRLRENQANRGQLDSGLGRQELLNMNLGYDAKTSDLKSAKTSAINEIMSLIAQAEAEANNNKANINNQYANALASLQAQLR